MGEVADAYAGCRARIGALVRDLEPAAASLTVPSCPEWTVHDVVAHVSGVVDDALNGRLDGVATDPWTAAQVEARRDRPIPQMLDEWLEGAPAFEALLDEIGPPGRQAVADLVTHEHDIRGALGQPGARDSDAVAIGSRFVANGFVAATRDMGVRARAEAAGLYALGPDDAEVTLRGSAFELLRAMTGRRSVEQIRELDCDGDVERVLPAFTFGPFRPAAKRIDE